MFFSVSAQEVDEYCGMEVFPPKETSHGTAFAISWYEGDRGVINSLD